MAGLVDAPPSTAGAEPASEGSDRPSARARLVAVLGSSWVPAGLLVALTFVVLRYYGVPLPTTAGFLLYIGLGITLPGTLWWRAARRRSGWLVADLAAGTALGYAVETLLYIGVRAIGAPLLVLAFPLSTIVAFLAVRRLRAYWRGSGDPAERTPAWWAWSICAVLGVLLFWSSIKFYRVHGLGAVYSIAPDADSTFHLALVGEAKHHMPLMSAWVLGEPVLYHFFVYAEMASTSWVTGIEPQVLLQRLSLLPIVATTAILLAVTARKLTGVWWAGPAAAIGTYFVLAPNPYPWTLNGWFSGFATSPYDDGSASRLVMWTSPTHTFAAMLFAGLVLVLVDLVGEHGGGARQWALAVILSVAVMGAKATFVPILLAAVLLVIAVHLVIHRRLHRRALALAGLTFGCLVFAQVVIFRGASQGLQIDPLHQMMISGASYTTEFAIPPHAPLWRLVVVAAITLVCWACVWGGVVGLVKGRRFLDPAIVLLLGIGAAGMGGILVFGEAGGAEGWFLGASRPYLSLAAVVGVASAFKVRAFTWRIAAALLGSVVAGGLVVYLIRRSTSSRIPYAVRIGGNKALAVTLAWPYLVMIAVAVAFGLGLLWLRHRRPVLRGLSFALVASLLAGMGLLTFYNNVTDVMKESARSGWRDVYSQKPYITEGGLQAGRWLRDHSGPNDVVATNAHCIPIDGTPPGKCDNRHFFISAYSERRVLVEGWGFTAAAHERALAAHVDSVFVDFWDQQRLADNDAAFDSPSAETVGRLRDKYGVKWLFVDETQRVLGPDLDRYATLVYRAGRCAVYKVNS